MSAVISPAAVNNISPTENQDDIKVMIVDDSVVVRGLVSSWVDQEDGMYCAQKCSNGAVAVEKIAEVRPDVVILDIEMPVMDGIEALPKLLKLSPNTTVIMASTLTQRNAEISLKAMSLGAADYVAKPTSNSGVSTSSAFRSDLLGKVTALGQKNRKNKTARLVRATKSATRGVQKTSAASVEQQEYSLRPFSTSRPKVLAIGSSTGGPPAMMKLVEQIGPAIKQVPVLVTQHMPATFTSIFAGHLARSSGFPAAEGVDGEQVVPGKIYVAPGGKHMIVERRGAIPTIRLTDGPEVNYCKPAVDPMFESLVKIYGPSVLATVLTGMGTDGANGAVKIADAGGSVLAQDEQSSVVWGMPGATAKAGACSAVLKVDEIAAKIKRIIQG